MSDAETFSKLDTPPTVRAWAAEACTVFANGFISGLGTGIGVGGAAAAQSGSTNPQTLSLYAAVGFVVAAASHGGKRVLIWHDRNPLPPLFQ